MKGRKKALDGDITPVLLIFYALVYF